MDSGCDSQRIIKGEFVTNGETFIFRLAGTPLSGIGTSPQDAFANLVRAESAAGPLPTQIQALAREQQGETVRASVIRTTMAGLIFLAVVGGALLTAAGMMPRVATQASTALMTAMNSWLDNLTPSQEEKVAAILQRVRTILQADACQKPQTPAVDGR